MLRFSTDTTSKDRQTRTTSYLPSPCLLSSLTVANLAKRLNETHVSIFNVSVPSPECRPDLICIESAGRLQKSHCFVVCIIVEFDLIGLTVLVSSVQVCASRKALVSERSGGTRKKECANHRPTSSTRPNGRGARGSTGAKTLDRGPTQSSSAPCEKNARDNDRA